MDFRVDFRADFNRIGDPLKWGSVGADYSTMLFVYLCVSVTMPATIPKEQ